VLELNGKSAFIEDSAALGSNSALTGLDVVAGALEMYADVSVTTAGTLVDSGSFYIDFPGRTRGSTLSTAGAITNSGTPSIGNYSLSSASTVATAALNNTGSIDLTGAGANQALIDVTTGVAGFGTAGTVTGTIDLHQDFPIEFPSGRIKRKETSEQIIGLRRAVIEYHSAVLGHGMLISELEARVRRIEQHLSLSGTDAN
jgi:hypothetical protein